MSTHTATISWKSDGPDFLKGRYSREHSWAFDGGLVVPASPAPTSVPLPFSNPASLDPEEAFVASLSSCHMLTFLYLAYKGGISVESYRDEAVGTMTKNDKGVPWVSSVRLQPKVVYRGRAPSAAEVERLHHEAHEQCYLSNSVRTEITVVS